jgi:lipopolysaccharide export system protein LptA
MLVVLLIALTPFRADRIQIYKEEDESIVHLIGNVFIEGEETKITCTEARINEARGWVKLFDEIKLSGRNGEVSAKNAIYYFNEDCGYLSNSVSIVTDNERMFSDSLYYDGKRDSVEMYGHVVIEDDRNHMTVSGDRGWYNLAMDEGILAGNPELRIIRDDKPPIIVYAGAFRLMTNDNLFMGYDSVQAVIDSINVFCDTFSYDLKAETGDMIMPIIREKNNELKGITGKFRLKDKEMDLLSVMDGQSVYYTDEGSENMVKGHNIEITFSQGKATTIRIEGRPRGILNLQRRQGNAGD